MFMSAYTLFEWNMFRRGDNMLTYIWSFMIILSFVCAGFTGKLADVSSAMIEGAKAAVTLTISISGVMALWSGFLKIAEKSNLTELFARAFMPLIRLLFPETKKDKDIAGAIAMNMTANFFGMGNAATPLGINAMKKLSAHMKNGIATSSMCMLAIINSSSIQLIPSTLIAIRSSMGSADPGEIMVPIWIASVFTFSAAVITAKLMEGRK